MPKMLLFGDEARKSIYEGVVKLSDAVATTLGPRGRNVLIKKEYGSPISTKDGVTVAREINLKDPFEDMGAQMVKEVAILTNDIVGDGTSSSTLLASAIFKECYKNITAGSNPMSVKRGIDKAVEVAVESLKKLSRDIGDKHEIAQVAAISANNDTVVGNIIADAMEAVGKEGVITIEESRSVDTYMEQVEGMQFDRGYLSPYMVTDPESMTATFDNPYILLYDKTISSLQDILPILEQVAKEGRPLLIMAEDVQAEALTTIVVNFLKGVIKCIAVKAPGFGDKRKELLKDLAIATGGTLVSEDLGLDLKTITTEHLGQAKKMVVNKDTTTLIEGCGDVSEIEGRIKQIKREITESTSDYTTEKLQERLAKLAGGVAVIYIGAPSEVELKDKKFRVEDALSATRAAVSEGIVPGGGWALLKVQKDVLSAMKGIVDLEEAVGFSIVAKALEMPMRQIAINSGDEGAVIVERTKLEKGCVGYNALTKVWEDLVKAGVIDPTKVVRCSLQHAASVASMLATTEVMITEDISKPQNKGDADMGGMM